MPSLMGLCLYVLQRTSDHTKLLRDSKGKRNISIVFIFILERYESAIDKSTGKSKTIHSGSIHPSGGQIRFRCAVFGTSTGEGWLLTGERMAELIHSGADNIICMQPFACLPNHVVGKGMIKELKRRNKNTNIVAIDYDPGASEVNQLNRIKLMISTAFENLKSEQLPTD